MRTAAGVLPLGGPHFPDNLELEPEGVPKRDRWLTAPLPVPTGAVSSHPPMLV